MIADISAWVALFATILSIGLELWRARGGDERGSGSADGPHSTSLADRLRFTRRVTAMSLVPVFVLVLSAYVLHAVSLSLELRASQVRDCIGDHCFGTTANFYEAANLELWVPIIDAVVVVIWITAAVMAARIVLSYGIRVVEWVLGLVRTLRARRAADDGRKISQVGSEHASSMNSSTELPQSRNAERKRRKQSPQQG